MEMWIRLFVLVFVFVTGRAVAQSDSVRVVRLLEKGRQEAKAPVHLWYARQLIGTPYVAQTLEVNPTEQLVNSFFYHQFAQLFVGVIDKDSCNAVVFLDIV